MNRRWMWSPWLLFLAGAAPPEATPVPAPEFALEAALTEAESTLADLYADFWREQYRVALGEPGASTLEIRARIRETLDEPGRLDALTRARFADRSLERRRRLFLEEAADARISGNPELSALTEELEKLYASTRFRVGGRELSRADLNTVVAQDPDRAKRREAWEAQAQMADAAAGGIRRAMALRQRLARQHAGESFPDFMLRRNQVDRARMHAWFEELRRETEGELGALSARMRKELGVETLEPWDLDYYFFRLAGPGADRALTRDSAWPRTKALARSLGYDLEAMPVTLRVADIAFGGGTYPIRYGREVRMLVNTYDGRVFTDTLLHEAGHALHYCFDAEPTFLLQSSYAQPFDEGLGQVVALLLYRPEVGARLFGLSRAEVRGLAESYRLASLMDLRQRMASSLFELAAYEDPDADLPALYDGLLRKYVGVSTHGRAVWAFNPFYASGPIYLQSYVIAEMVGRQIHQAVDRRFGRRWGPEAGEYLRRKFFSRGGSLTLDEILVEGTGEPLSARALIAAWKAAP